MGTRLEPVVIDVVKPEVGDAKSIKTEESVDTAVEERKADLQRDLDMLRMKQEDLLKKREVIESAMRGLQQQLEQRSTCNEMQTVPYP